MDIETINALSDIIEKIGTIGVLLLVWQQSSRRADMLLQFLIEDWKRDKDRQASTPPPISRMPFNDT